MENNKEKFNYNKVSKSKEAAKDIPKDIVAKNEPEKPIEEPKPKKAPTGKINAPLNLREEPRKDAKILTVMPMGAVVTLESEELTNGFYKVKYNEFEGFAMAQFINKR